MNFICNASTYVPVAVAVALVDLRTACAIKTNEFEDGICFSYIAIDFYVNFGRLNTNLTILAAGTILIGIVLLISAILLYTLVNVVRENRN